MSKITTLPMHALIVVFFGGPLLPAIAGPVPRDGLEMARALVLGGDTKTGQQCSTLFQWVVDRKS